MGKIALVLCSGGLDSSVLAYHCKSKMNHNKLFLVFFDYGQLSLVAERQCVKKTAENLKASLVEIKIPQISKIGKTKTSKNLRDTKEESKSWYFPFRNTIFISHAVAVAEKIIGKNKDSADILLGFKSEGQEHYPDTTKEYVKEMNQLIKVAIGDSKILVKTPFIEMDKEDIITLGIKLGVNFTETSSCYQGMNCGACLACRLRREGFKWANISDPTIYKTKKK